MIYLGSGPAPGRRCAKTSAVAIPNMRGPKIPPLPSQRDRAAVDDCRPLVATQGNPTHAATGRNLFGCVASNACWALGRLVKVYLGTHEDSGRQVAVKVVYPGMRAHPGLLDRFEREARLAYQLDHPALIPVLHWDINGDHPFLVMAYIDGATLERLIRYHGRLDRASLPQSLPMLPTPSITCMAWTLFTVTSSRPICWSPRAAVATSLTWVWPGKRLVRPMKLPVVD